MSIETAQPNPMRRWRWLIVALLGVLILFFPMSGGAAAPKERVFHIDASRFEYDPGVIKVNPGDRVTIELVAKDVVHGISVDGYAVETTADPGETARISFIADKPGTYRFRCTSTCGNLHPFMIGKLEVGQNTLLWRAIALMGLALMAGFWKGWK